VWLVSVGCREVPVIFCHFATATCTAQLRSVQLQQQAVCPYAGQQEANSDGQAFLWSLP
jgi:hypothetical protein